MTSNLYNMAKGGCGAAGVKSAPKHACLRADSLFYAPTHDVAPRAVTMAVATDAMICTINLMVSFLLMVSLGY